MSPYSPQAPGGEAKAADEGTEATTTLATTDNGEEADEGTLAKKMALEDMRKLRQDPRYREPFIALQHC